MPRPDENPLLAYARELEASDRTLAAAAGHVEELRRETRLVRERADAAAGVLRRLPERRAAAEEALAEAERELARRRQELEEARDELARAEGAGDAERLAAARRAEVRTRDAQTSARARLERARTALEELERAAVEAGDEAPRLDARARTLAERIGRIPRVSARASEAPEEGLGGASSWAARAEAALWVARGAIETERERVVREANELGASVLGEPLAATSVALVRERLERR